MSRMFGLILECWLVVLILVNTSSGQPGPSGIDFRRQIAPLLTQRCLNCHHPGLKKGGLDLSSAPSVRAGGDSGPVLVPGKPGESYLLEKITGRDGKKPSMPRGGTPLSNSEVDLVRRWIEQGAAWPETLTLQASARTEGGWWSLQPLGRPQPPSPTASLPPGWDKNPLDRFLLAKMQARGLSPSPEADRRTLIRRVTFDVLGLPPSPEEIEAFVKDARPDAYERLVDRLLASPHYGEQWGRHWLDVIRFGESRGYERNEIIDNLWPFRDYIIRSFNDDKPFRQLVLEHLAGDVLGPGQPEIEIGTAFLVCGPYDDVGNQDPIQAALIRANTIDDMIRATGESFLGLTIGCARCHDHKFDPVRKEDYYQMYATFAGVHHGSRPLASAQVRKTRQEKVQPLETTRARLRQQIRDTEEVILKRARARSLELEKTWVRPAPRFEFIEETFAPAEARMVRLHTLANSSQPASNRDYWVDEFEIFTDSTPARNVALAANGARAEGASRVAEDFAEAYSSHLAINGQYGDGWNAAGPDLTITLARTERIRRVVFSSNRAGGFPRSFPAEYRIEVSLDGRNWREVASSFDRQPVSEDHRRRRYLQIESKPDEVRTLARLQADLDRRTQELAQIPPIPVWWAGQFEPAEGPFHVFLGGDPQKKGTPVVPASLQVLEKTGPHYSLGSKTPESQRRLALAKWLVDPENPLTPRVLVNRLWHYHFGTGIVDTPSDFGKLGGQPTHPELLDWLARRLLEHGWKLKPLQREILLSQAYRQAGTFRSDMARLDASARFLWRFPPRRLTAEEVRDTMLAVAGKLDLRLGGPGFRLYRYLQDNVATYVPLDHPGPETYRRAVYHQNARAARVDVLTDFDCPDNAFAAPTRVSTTTPLQALTLLNHRFTLDLAQTLALRLEREAGKDQPGGQVRRAFLLTFGRLPETAEESAAVTLIRKQGLPAFCRALFNANEFLYID